MRGSESYVSMAEFVAKAIEFEVESAEFYRDLADRVENHDSVETLRELEKQERDHASTLRDYDLPEDDDSRLQFKPRLSLNMPPAPKKTDVGTLFKHAIERERKSARLYDFASDLAAGDFKQLLSSLADFERGHEEDLKRLRKTLRK
jgi:rubrerythrin